MAANVFQYAFLANGFFYSYDNNTYTYIDHVGIQNSSVYFTLSLPTQTQIDLGTYFLNANGSWVNMSSGNGGITYVVTDGTLTGNGTLASPLSVANPGITSVVHDGTLTGNGTVSSPLSVVYPSANIDIKALLDAFIDALPKTPAGLNLNDWWDNGGVLVKVRSLVDPTPIVPINPSDPPAPPPLPPPVEEPIGIIPFGDALGTFMSSLPIIPNGLVLGDWWNNSGQFEQIEIIGQTFVPVSGSDTGFTNSIESFRNALNRFKASLLNSPSGLNVGDWWNNDGQIEQIEIPNIVFNPIPSNTFLGQLNTFKASLPNSPSGLTVGQFWNNRGKITRVEHI